CHYDAGGVRWRGEEDSERGQNEQGSHRLDSPSRIFDQRSFTAEPLCCGGIVWMLLDRVTRSSRRATPAAEGRSTRSSRSRNANLSVLVQSPLRIHVGLLYSQPC